jgi:rare lipoprotein A
VMASSPRTLRVVASWYGDESGKVMANGKHYDKLAMTVAHKTLPFGTRLLLTNPTTGRMVVAVVTDRGPYVKGRSLDCSEGVAITLGFKRQGVAQLTAIVLDDLPAQPTVLQAAHTKAIKAKGLCSFPDYVGCVVLGAVAPTKSLQDYPLLFQRHSVEKPVNHIQRDDLFVVSSGFIEFPLTYIRADGVINP